MTAFDDQKECRPEKCTVSPDYVELVVGCRVGWVWWVRSIASL